MTEDKPLSEQEIAQIEERCKAATPGLWRSFVEGRDHQSGSDFIQTPDDDIELSGATVEDQDFIAHARQDVPRLLREVKRLRRRLRRGGIDLSGQSRPQRSAADAEPAAARLETKGR